MPSSITPPPHIRQLIQQIYDWASDAPDPEVVAEQALAAIELHQAAIPDLSALREAQVAALHAQGWSYPELGEAFGISYQRAWQIVNPTPKKQHG